MIRCALVRAGAQWTIRRIFPRNAKPVSRFPFKLTRSDTLCAGPLDRPPDLRSHRPGLAQVLPGLIPDPVTILDRLVGALEQIVHLRQSTGNPNRSHESGRVVEMVMHIGTRGIIELRQAIARRAHSRSADSLSRSHACCATVCAQPCPLYRRHIFHSLATGVVRLSTAFVRRAGAVDSLPTARPQTCQRLANSARWSARMTRAALWPGAPVTPPPGWAPAPQ